VNVWVDWCVVIVDTGWWVWARYGTCCWCFVSSSSPRRYSWSLDLVVWSYWPKNELDQTSHRHCQCKVRHWMILLIVWHRLYCDAIMLQNNDLRSNFHVLVDIWLVNLGFEIWFVFWFIALTLLVGCQEEHRTCKKWMMRCWHGYLSGVACKWYAYGPADTTATLSPLASL